MGVSSNRWHADLGSRRDGREHYTNSRRRDLGERSRRGPVLDKLVVLEDLVLGEDAATPSRPRLPRAAPANSDLGWSPPLSPKVDSVPASHLLGSRLREWERRS